MRFYRQPPTNRLAQAALLRGRRVRVVTREGRTHEGRLLAVGVALHGTSTDWLAVTQDDNQVVDRFVSLATIETIDEIAAGTSADDMIRTMREG